jgi:predicted membrane protein
MAKQKFSSSNSDITSGLILLLVGAVLFFKAMGFWFPVWFISWPMLFIAVGLVVLVRHNFQNGFGFFLVIFGSVFLVSKYFHFPFELRPFLIPVGLIIFGLYLILKRSKDNKRFNEEFFGSFNQRYSSGDQQAQEAGEANSTGYFSGVDHSDVLNAQALFTGIVRRVSSKNFKGGKTSAIFGGVEIDLSKADFEGLAVLNVEIAFGGVKLVVPPNWEVQTNLGTVFAAGVEDKRFYDQTGTDSNKVLKINGSLVFGGLEIKSF